MLPGLQTASLRERRGLDSLLLCAVAVFYLGHKSLLNFPLEAHSSTRKTESLVFFEPCTIGSRLKGTMDARLFGRALSILLPMALVQTHAGLVDGDNGPE